AYYSLIPHLLKAQLVSSPVNGIFSSFAQSALISAGNRLSTALRLIPALYCRFFVLFCAAKTRAAKKVLASIPLRRPRVLAYHTRLRMGPLLRKSSIGNR